MNNNVFTPSYAFTYSEDNVHRLASELTTLLEAHTNDGHLPAECTRAINLAMACMVIDASRSGYGSIGAMKTAACDALQETVGQNFYTEPADPIADRSLWDPNCD